MNWTLAPKARADLLDIWDYSDARWGETQADRYLDDIYRAIEESAAGMRLVRERSGVRRGYIEARSGAHIIFLKRVARGWLVVRVLHQRMDIERHLP